MRIVGGQFRGLKLADPGGGDSASHLRPTTDRVREAIFNLLAHGGYGQPAPPTDAHVLDLFAGTGALGIEALSRGAASVTSVDNGTVALRLLKENAAVLPKPSGLNVLRADARSLVPNTGPAADLVFLDPPYGTSLGQAALTAARDQGWIAPRALVVWEDESTPVALSWLRLRDARQYGRSVVSIFEEHETVPNTLKESAAR